LLEDPRVYQIGDLGQKRQVVAAETHGIVPSVFLVLVAQCRNKVGIYFVKYPYCFQVFRRGWFSMRPAKLLTCE
jgi:hypothetical protein